LMFALRKRDFA